MTKQEQKIDEMVRDFCSVVPRSKSEVRRRISTSITRAIEENETELGRAFASGMKAGRQKMYIKGFKDGFKHSGEGFNGEYAHPDLPKNFLARDAKEALSSLDKPLKD